MNCYAAFAKNEDIRKLGSSGGIFPVLAKTHILNGGIVYASIYDEQLNVKFTRIDNEELLEKSFTSKYVQSRLGDTFRKLETDLKDNRKVLFCGTPCQATGLREYLRKKRINCDNLLIIDIICHGVPSETVFHKFMNCRYENCTSINMRNKDLGWNWGRYAWKMRFSDGSEETVPQANIAYMKGFISNIYLRPSCYHCVAKTNVGSDITLGDFWGISNINEKIPTRYGVSCVIIRTEAGQNAFSQSSDDIECFNADYKDILSGNPSLENSVAKPVYRARFFKKMISCPDSDMENLIDSMSSPSLINKIINKAYKKLPKGGTGVRDLTDNNEKVFYSKKESCCACSACFSVCPVDAISMKKDKEGFFYAVIDSTKCIDCGACKRVCPFAS